MKLKILLLSLILALGFTSPSQATENYIFDIKGQHAFIQFKIKHMGFSWLIGNFNTFTGSFTYDKANPENNSVTAEIEVASIDSNHALRDKHLRSDGYFDVAQFPKATFSSTSYEEKGDGKGVLTGNFALRGITKEIVFDITQVGAGPDPWGGFRRGFYGTTTLHLSDYNMKKSLGPAAEDPADLRQRQGADQDQPGGHRDDRELHALQRQRQGGAADVEQGAAARAKEAVVVGGYDVGIVVHREDVQA